MMSPLWVCVVLAATPVTESRFVFSLRGAPVGLVELQRDGARYRYRSTHFFRDGATRRQEDRFELSDGPLPQGLALWNRPAAKVCTQVVEEVTRTRGELCVDSVKDRTVEGRLGTQKFSATYGPDGLLQRLTLGAATFERTAQFSVKAADPFAEGFAVAAGPGPLTLEPALTGAAVQRPRPVGQPGVQTGECLPLADAYVAKHPGSRRVMGLLVDQGRAFPHAWVVTRAGEAVDPSAWLAPEKPSADYLVLPDALAAEVFLELLDGRRTVTRKKSL